MGSVKTRGDQITLVDPAVLTRAMFPMQNLPTWNLLIQKFFLVLNSNSNLNNQRHTTCNNGIDIYSVLP